MTIPVSTTRVSILRRLDQSNHDPWETSTDDLETVASDIRAVIAVGSGGLAGQTIGPGDSEAIRFTLLCDPTDLRYLDVVEDSYDGRRYAVQWVMASPGIVGLANVRAGLSSYQGFGEAEQ